MERSNSNSRALADNSHEFITRVRKNSFENSINSLNESDLSSHTPRTAYAIRKENAERHLSDVMKHLNYDRMAAVHESFENAGGAIDIYQFIEIMRQNLPELHATDTILDFITSSEKREEDELKSQPHRLGNQRGSLESIEREHYLRTQSPSSTAIQIAEGVAGNEVHKNQAAYDAEVALVANLCELFWEIDINGDSTLEWDEFVSFIVEKANVHNLKQRAGQTTAFHPIQKLENPAKRNVLNNLIDKVDYIPYLDSLLVTEQHSPVVRLYDATDCSELGRVRHSSMVCCATYAHHVGFNSDGEYVARPFHAEGAGSLITAGDDRTMTIWDVAPGSRQYTPMTSLPVPHLQTAMCWVPRHRKLMTASTAGLVHSWDLEKRTETSATYGHQDIVTDILHLADLDNLASAGMDRQVSIWDICTGARRQQLLGHKRGVLSLAFSADQRMLISVGLDHEAHVWSPFAPTLLYKLKGHGTSLLSVRALPDVPQVVTADMDGILKVWDLRTFQCMQTFTGDSSLRGMTSLAICAGGTSVKPKVVAATKYLHFFDESDAFATCVTHDIPIVAALFNTVSMTILTAAGRTVKIWDAITGRIRRIFADIVPSDITVVQLDDRKRKFIIGDHSGTIRVFDYSNGAPMKYLGRHKSEVTAILYLESEKSVLSAAWDTRVLVHDELDPERGVVLREMDSINGHKQDVNCLSYSHSLSVLASGSLDRTVRIWDFETGKVDSLLQQDAPVTCVVILKPWPLIAVTTTAGTITVWGLRGSQYRDAMILRVAHKRRDCEEALSTEESVVLCVNWDSKKQRLFTGDEYGTVRCFSLSELLTTLDDKVVNGTSEATHAPNGERENSNAARKSKVSTKYSGIRLKPVPELEEGSISECWKAQPHEDTITSLQHVEKHNLLLTSSVDCRAKVLSNIDGREMGILVQGISSKGAHRSRHWDVPYDIPKMHEEDISFARRLVDKSKDQDQSHTEDLDDLECPSSRSRDWPNSSSKSRKGRNGISRGKSGFFKTQKSFSGKLPTLAHSNSSANLKNSTTKDLGSPMRDLSSVVKENARKSILNDIMGSIY